MTATPSCAPGVGRRPGAARGAPSARRAVGALLVAAGLLAGCAHVERDAALAERVDALVAPLLDAHQFSGAIVMTRDDRVLVARGYGMAEHASDRAPARPFTPDTPTDGGSLAKTFTAAALQWLAHEGRVDLAAPVRRYVAEYPHAQTTVAQLLQHSNGLPDDYAFFDPHFGADQVRSTPAMLAIVAREAPRPSFEPGTRFEYSNLGFDAAALVIERVSGQGYEAFVRERFFGPLGMRHSFARPPRLADWPGARTLGYRWRDDAWQVFDVYDREAFLGGSNLYFSATDLARWGAAHAAGRALPPAVAAVGARPALIDGQASAINGLSWYCDREATRCHYSGTLNAFHSLVHWDRRRRESVVMVSNSTLPPWQAITLQRGLVGLLAGRSPRAEPATAFAAIGREARAGVAGTYAADGVGRLTVRADGRVLSLRMGCGLPLRLFQVTREVFVVPGSDQFIAFAGAAVPDRLHLRSMALDATLHRVDDAADAGCPGSAAAGTGTAGRGARP